MADHSHGPVELEKEVLDTLRKLEQSEKISLFSVATLQMRTFHLSWFSFFLAFFGWFGIAPLMVIVRDDLGLTKAQVGDTIIASVMITVVARPLIGWVCDWIGPRLTYSGLLAVGAIPVMGIGLAQSYETFLLFRLAIGVIGGAFVITQYHTSKMFSANVVGTANAITAGWGNLGGGVTQIVMPLVLAVVMLFGVDQFLGWRIAMVIPGVAMLLMAVVYYFFTQDTPFGNFSKLRAEGRKPQASNVKGTFRQAASDYRVWVLFLAYGACLGVELTIFNVAALYYHDRFGLSVAVAGLIAGLFGMTNLFARPLGGFVGDRAWDRFGLSGRVMLLAIVLLLSGVALVLFAHMSTLLLSVAVLVLFGVLVQMSEGATYSVVPFINTRALGSVAGIVGAGGTIAAVAFGFLFRDKSLSTQDALTIVGIAVIAVAILVFLARSSLARET